MSEPSNKREISYEEFERTWDGLYEKGHFTMCDLTRALGLRPRGPLSLEFNTKVDGQKIGQSSEREYFSGIIVANALEPFIGKRVKVVVTEVL